MIQYRTRQAYGRTLRDIVDPAQAQAFYALTGCRTIADNAIASLRALGVECREV